MDIDKCPIQHESNDIVTELIRKFINTYNISVYHEGTHKGTHIGIIRHVVTKVGYNSNQLMVIIVTNGHLIKRKELVPFFKY